METGKLDIYVYAHWQGMPEPKTIGVLAAHYAKGKKAFSFEYDNDWIKSEQQLLLDPDIQFYSGPQYPNNKENFGVFLDSMSDTWGRTLMKRRAAHEAKEKNEKASTLYEIDFLLGVYDESRMGALRFKLDPNGAFLDDNEHSPTPPWSSVRELQEAAKNFENDTDNEEVKKWLDVLMAPGSSLGGARPKANILDEHGNLWIAKFPSKNDTIDKGAWEFLAYQLAINCGIDMAPSRIEKVVGNYHTFFTQRFDRGEGERIHFSSAMTMTGNNEDTIRDNPASYLDLAEFIQNYGANINKNLKVAASGAVVRGKFNTYYVTGREGNQGPYKIFGVNNEPAILIIEGSEVVYINGVPIEGGEDKDYTIEETDKSDKSYIIDGEEITQETIDSILDKISASGYQNLSEREKLILNELSKRL